LCGIPLMAPSFCYRGVHDDHHKSRIYGRPNDGEYVPFGAGPRIKIIGYLLLPAVLPLIFAARFIVFTPLSLLHPKLRELVWSRASSLAIDLSYQRPAFSSRDDPDWRNQEIGAFAFGSAALTLAALGVLPWRALAVWYAVGFVIFFLNSLRTLAAHRYRNTEDAAMSSTDQFLDSVDVPGSRFWTALWAPVGLRYHATHHLLPGLPYHHLAAAHRRLTDRLSDNSLLLAARRRSLWHALTELFEDAGSRVVTREIVAQFRVPEGQHPYSQPVPKGLAAATIELDDDPGILSYTPRAPQTEPLMLPGSADTFSVSGGDVVRRLPLTQNARAREKIEGKR
jgi:fatty acid desaturase